jgi:hypothetical protein
MGVDLRMEPYAEMFEKEARIIDELCFPDIDKLCDRLGLSWGDFYAVIDNEGRRGPESRPSVSSVSARSTTLRRFRRTCIFTSARFAVTR